MWPLNQLNNIAQLVFFLTSFHSIFKKKKWAEKCSRHPLFCLIQNRNNRNQLVLCFIKQIMKSMKWHILKCNMNHRFLISLEDTVHITKEHHPTNLLFSLFSSFFCPFVSCCLRQLSSTPSKSGIILYDETFAICLLTKLQAYTGETTHTIYIHAQL